MIGPSLFPYISETVPADATPGASSLPSDHGFPCAIRSAISLNMLIIISSISQQVIKSYQA